MERLKRENRILNDKLDIMITNYYREVKDPEKRRQIEVKLKSVL